MPKTAPEPVDLRGKTVILKKKYHRGEDEDRAFLCESGFGCTPGLRGTAIFGRFVKTGREARIERFEIQRLA